MSCIVIKQRVYSAVRTLKVKRKPCLSLCLTHVLGSSDAVSGIHYHFNILLLVGYWISSYFLAQGKSKKTLKSIKCSFLFGIFAGKWIGLVTSHDVTMGVTFLAFGRLSSWGI